MRTATDFWEQLGQKGALVVGLVGIFVALLWEREIKRTLAGPVFQREWTVVTVEFAHDGDFLHYIDALVRRRRP